MNLFKYIIFHINGKQLLLWQIFFKYLQLLITTWYNYLHYSLTFSLWVYVHIYVGKIKSIWLVTTVMTYIFLFCVVFFYMCIVLVIFCTFIHLTTVFHETAFGWEPRVFIITQSNFFSPFPILISPLHLNTNSVITVRVHTFLNGSDQC